MMRRFSDLSIRRKLSVLLLLSSGIGLVVAATALISYAFSTNRAAAERDLQTLAQVLADNSTAAVAFQDREAARDVLVGLRAKPEVEYACVYAGDAAPALFATYGRLAAGGCPVRLMADQEAQAGDLLHVRTPVVLDGEHIGVLLLGQNLSVLTAALQAQIKLTLVILGVSFIVSFAVAWWLQRDLTRPILNLAQVARQVTESRDYSVRAQGVAKDEVGNLIADFNAMLGEVERQSQEIQHARDALAQQVEDKSRANAELESAMNRLKLAQEQLVQSEKLASLGGLVAGVAHEINTPVGVSVTAASTLQDETERLGVRFAEGSMKRSDLSQFMEIAAESSQIILKNLARAADLIQSFKRVAVDQSSEEQRRFLLKDYMDEVLLSLRPQLKKTQHEVEIDCPADLQINGYPGVIAQIVTNLVGNSLVHAFDEGASGHLRFEVRRDGEDWVQLRYSDDGKGIAADQLPRIFDPFYTTRRGSGGSGLGLHIVYNLATQMLGGEIKVSSQPGEGVSFDLRFPTQARRQAA